MAPRIMVEIVGDSSKLVRELKKSKGSMQGLGSAAGMAGVAVTGGLALAAGAAINAAGDFQQSLNIFQAVSAATGKEMDAVRKKAIQLGADIHLPGTSAKDAADAMRELAKGGLTAKQAMESVRGTLVLSAAAGIENAQAAEIQVNAMNAFGLSAKSAASVADMLANAANASSVEITDVADALKMAGAVFSNFQGPVVGSKNALQDLTTAVALLGNAGIKGSDAGTSLKQSLLMLASPSDKSKDAMRALYLASLSAGKGQEFLTAAVAGGAKARGDAIGELQDAAGATAKAGDIAYTATGRMRSFKDIIALVAKGTKHMTDEQRNMYVGQIFGSDATRAVLVLMKAQNGEWDKMHDKVGKAGAAQAIAAARMKGFKGSMDAFKSTLDTLAITMGTPLLGAATKVMGVLSTMANFFTEHTTTAKIFVGVIAGLAAVLLTASIVTKTMAAAQVLLNIAMSANPIGLIVVAIAALVAGLILAYQHSATFRAVVQGAFQGVMQAVTFLRAHWEQAFTVIKAVFAPTIAIIKMYVAVVVDVVRLVGALLRGDWSEAWRQAKKIVSDVITGIKGYLGGMLSNLGAVLPLAGHAAMAIGKAIVLGILKLEMLEVKLLRMLIAKIDAAIIGVSGWVFSAAIRVGSLLIGGVINGIKSMAGSLAGAVKHAVSSAVGFAGRALHGSGDFMFTKHVIGIPMARGVIEGWNEGLLPLGGNMVSKLRGAIQTAKTTTGPDWRAVGQAMGQSLGDGVINSLQSLEGRMSAGLRTALDTAWQEAWNGWAGSVGVVAGIAAGAPFEINIPGFAGGVKNFGGGFAVVGEGGPELVRLPRGSDVIPAGGGGSSASGGGVVEQHFHFGNYVGDKRDLIDMIRTEGARISKRNGGTVLPGFAT